jgi:hypothetical protein
LPQISDLDLAAGTKLLRTNGEKAALIRAQPGRNPSQADSILITKNLGDFVDRLKKAAPDAYRTVLAENFSGSRSTLSKYTKANASEVRLKFSTYLAKAVEIGRTLSQTDAGFSSDNIILDLVRGTKMALEIDYATSSSFDRAIDELHFVLEQTADYIERETGLTEKIRYLNMHQWHMHDGETGPVLKAGPGGRESTNGSEADYLWDLLPRVQIGRLAYSVKGALNLVPEERMRVRGRRVLIDPSDTIKSKSDFQVSEDIFVVAAVNHPTSPLRLFLERRYKVELFIGRDEKASISWDGRLKEGMRSSEASTGHTKIIAKKTLDPGKYWATFAKSDIPDRLVGRPTIPSGPPAGNERNILSFSRSNLTDWVSFRNDSGWVGGSDVASHPPSELGGYWMLSNYLEYAFIHTASSEDPLESRFFITPAILDHAKQFAAIVNAYRESHSARKQNSIDKLLRIFGGDEKLDR